MNPTVGPLSTDTSAACTAINGNEVNAAKKYTLVISQSCSVSWSLLWRSNPVRIPTVGVKFMSV